MITADTSLTFVTSFQRTSGGATALGTVSLDTTTTNLIGTGGVLNGAPGNFGSSDIVGYGHHSLWGEPRDHAG